MLWDMLWDIGTDLKLSFLFMPSPSLLNTHRRPPSPLFNVTGDAIKCHKVTIPRHVNQISTN